MVLQEIYERVKESYNIVEVVANYVKLKKVGRNFVGLCPFHSEKTPSFVVSPEKQIFKCFGCGEAGDVITFYMKINGISFKEALVELAEKIGIYVEERIFIEKKKEEELIELNYKVAKFYHSLLFFYKEKNEAWDYLKDRGIDEETAKVFMLGFAPPEGRVLCGYLRNLKGDLKLGEELGLVRKSQDGSYVDLFRYRIIFPIFNLKGECVGFGGRTLSKEEEPKYLNTPDSKIYKKSEVLYGLYQAKEFIKKERTGFIVEGYFDLLSLWIKGIKNVVATCGTALTSQHVKLLKNLAENWIILYDGDEAGKKATLRAISLFLKEGILPKCILLPEGEDPDSFTRKSKEPLEKFLKILEELSVDAISFVIKFYEKDFKLYPSKIFQEIVEIFKEIEDPFLKRQVVRELSSRLDISEGELLKALTQKRYALILREKSLEHQTFDSEMVETSEDGCLKIIAQYLINYPEDLEVLEEVGLTKYLEFTSSKYSKFLKTLIEEIKKDPKKIHLVSDQDFQTFLSDILFNPPFEDRKEVLHQIKDFILKELTKLELKKMIENLKILQTKGSKEEIEHCLFLLKNLSFKVKQFLNKERCKF